VDINRFQVRHPADKNGDGTFQVLSIGTLHEVKGQRYLIDAVAALRDQGMYVACDLVGDGPDRDALERQVQERGLENYVTFFGHRSRDQVIEHLGRADLLVAPSVPSSDGRREGIPVVLIEAMASGVPVVASRLSGIPELVHHEQTGLLAQPGDVDDLCAAIRRLITDRSLAQRLGYEGRRYVEAEFNLHENANALAQLFAEVSQ
jgi:glycosyltransferase involved in cell wall biosynthesis